MYFSEIYEYSWSTEIPGNSHTHATANSCKHDDSKSSFLCRNEQGGFISPLSLPSSTLLHTVILTFRFSPKKKPCFSLFDVLFLSSSFTFYSFCFLFVLTAVSLEFGFLTIFLHKSQLYLYLLSVKIIMLFHVLFSLSLSSYFCLPPTCFFLPICILSHWQFVALGNLFFFYW